MMGAEEKRSLIDQARMANAVVHFERSIYQGDVENGWMMAGQDVGAIRHLPTCQEVVEQTVAEAEELLVKAGMKYSIMTGAPKAV
jgi:NAD(P)H-dependent flavin oxidoreductase YrpB (nitropropane dioxygenase family)